MKPTNNFQYLILGVFIFFAVAGVAAFSIYGKLGSKDKGPSAELSIWGLEDSEYFEELLSRIDGRVPDSLKITYVEKREENLDGDLIEALASGKGPDMLLLPHDRIVRHADKIYQIPFDSYGQRAFRDNFIEAAEVFTGPSGYYALPFSLDPLVMYWNRQLFSNVGLVLPPQYWDEFFSVTIPLTEMDNSRNILRSSVALGEYSNIVHAKEIISTLLLQSGNKITAKNAQGELVSVIGEKSEGGLTPLESSVRFYTEFSNPAKQVYSWNKSLPDSKSSFISSDLAVYFGFASEASELVAKNPNLNFDVALMPQVRDASKITFGKISGLAILERSPHKADAISAIGILTSQDSLRDWTAITVLPPVSRKLVAKRPKDSAPAVFYDSAVIARAWIDPDREKTGEIFKKMIENVTTGRLKLSEATARAAQELSSILR